MKQIHFEPHPVTPERKAELKAAGYKIIDARFAPEAPADVPAAPAMAEQRTRRKRGEIRE